MNITYRFMTSNDLELIVNFENEIRVLDPGVFSEFNEDVFRHNFILNKIEDFSLNEVILCLDGDKLIGRVDLIVEKSFMDFENIGYIDWVYVSKPYRKNGLAKCLFKEAVEYFNKLECKMYYLFVADNEEARGFYNSIDIKIESIDRASKKLN